jgi:hypothetical protein
MEWIGSLVATFVLVLLVVPMVAALGSVFFMAVAGWAFYGSPSVARAGFYCPFSERWVTAGFLTRPGSEQPSDVVSCSRFADECAVTCAKGCVKLAQSGWAASCMEPRYALLSGDVAYRPIAGAAR